MTVKTFLVRVLDVIDAMFRVLAEPGKMREFPGLKTARHWRILSD